MPATKPPSEHGSRHKIRRSQASSSRRPAPPPSSSADLPANSVAGLVVHYGDPQLTERAIQSMTRDPRDQKRLACIVVVDNDPRPGHRWGNAPASVRGVPLIRVVSATNRGFGGGVNLGLESLPKPTPPYVFLLNNDAYVSPGAITHLIRAAREHPMAILIAPLILEESETKGADPRNLKGAHVWSAGGMLDLPKARAMNAGLDETWDEQGPWAAHGPRKFVSGCAWLGMTEALKEINGFDPDYFLYYEDVDLCLRLAREFPARTVGWYCPNAVVWHGVSKGLDFSPMQEYYNWRNRRRLIAKHRYAMGLATRSYLYAAGTAHAIKHALGARFGHAAAILRGLLGS